MAAPKCKSKRPKKGAAKASVARTRAASGVSMTDALAEAAWAEADLALAGALVDYDALETAVDKTARKDALALLGQSLARAARKRGLRRIGELGARAVYDPAQHEPDGKAVKKSKKVTIKARGVARGDEVLMRPRVGRRGKKKRP